jgi:hypothetical protein
MIKVLHAMVMMLLMAIVLNVNPALADETSLRSYMLHDHGRLEMQIPLKWGESLRRPPENLPPTIEFRLKTGAPFRVLITPMWAASKNISLPEGEDLRKSVRKSADQIAPNVVEKEISLVELKGPFVHGYYFSATDRAPEPGGYKFLTQGHARVGDLIVIFTILTNEGQESIISHGIEIIRSSVHKVQAEDKATTKKKADTESPASAGKTYRIFLPTGQSTIVFPLSSFLVKEADPKTPYYFFVDENSHLSVSFNFEPAIKCNNSEDCRDYFDSKLKRLYPQRIGWTNSEVDGVYISENIDMSEPVKGMSLRQKHINAHYVRDGIWIDMHLSKPLYDEKDRELFLKFIRSVTIE